MVVLVTGAGSGVGRQTALGAAARGASTVLLDRDAAAVTATASEIEGNGGRAHAIATDIVSEDAVQSAFAEAFAIDGRLDVVIHAAGIMRGQRLDIREMTEDLWDQVIDVNLKGSFFVAKYAVTHMLPQTRGTIVLVASQSGITVGSGSLAYGASKGGINGLSMSLARQVAAAGIRVHTLCPGDIDTDFLDMRPVVPGSDDRALMLTPEDVAHTVQFVLDSPPHVCVNELVVTPTKKQG